MDIWKAEIARKRKLLEDKKLVDDGKKCKRGELLAKEGKEYLMKCGHHKEENTSPQKNTDCATTSTNESDQQILPHPEVIKRLRDRGESIMLFGEDELDRITQPEVTDLHKTDNEEEFLGSDQGDEHATKCTSELAENILNKEDAADPEGCINDLAQLAFSEKKIRKTKKHTEPLRKSPRKVQKEPDYIRLTPPELLASKPSSKPTKNTTIVKRCFKKTVTVKLDKGISDVSTTVSIDGSGSDVSTEMIHLPVTSSPIRKNSKDSVPGNSITEHRPPSNIDESAHCSNMTDYNALNDCQDNNVSSSSSNKFVEDVAGALDALNIDDPNTRKKRYCQISEAKIEFDDKINKIKFEITTMEGIINHKKQQIRSLKLEKRKRIHNILFNES